MLAQTACKGSGAPSPKPADLSATVAAYVMSDTAPYQNLVTSGTFAMLHKGGVFIDSVDVAFGVEAVGSDSVIFLPVRSAPDGAGRIATSITEHILFDGSTRTPVKSFAPHFDSHFSSPSVMSGALYYWGIFQSNGIDSVEAVRYEFGRRRLNTIPLPVKPPGTDDRFYLKPPYLEGKEFVFKADTSEWHFRTPKQR